MRGNHSRKQRFITARAFPPFHSERTIGPELLNQKWGIEPHKYMKKYFKELAIGLYIVRVAGLKNKWLGTPAALVIGFLLQAGPAAAQTNILTNPGFETGDTTGWFAFGTPTL